MKRVKCKSFLAILAATTLLALAGCGEHDPHFGISPERTALYWKHLQETLAPVEPGFREAKLAKETAKKLLELRGSVATSQPDHRLQELVGVLQSTFSDYADVIEGHQLLSKLVLTQQATPEERRAYQTSVTLFIKLDKRFYELQDKLEKHRVAMEERYAISLPPQKRIRQQFLVEAGGGNSR